MKLKKAILLISALLILTACIGTTLAILSSRSRPVHNTFTVGEIQLTLTESVAGDFMMIPGVSHTKDPRITVKGGSESCWLFCKITEGGDLDIYMDYAIDEGWTPLASDSDVFWREVGASDSNVTFPILEGDVITVRDTVTEQQLASITTEPTLTFFAYAIQREGVSTAQDAWQIIINKQEDEA